MIFGKWGVAQPAELCGMSGLSYADTKKILPDATNVYPHWKEESQLRKDWDLFDFKTDMYSTRAIAEVHIRKARNFADSINANMILPFANQHVAEYFAKMPEEYLFDRKAKKNKLILRKILKERIGIDSDALGKLGFSYDSRSIVLQNWDWMLEEIQECRLWHQPGLVKVVNRLKGVTQSNHKYAVLSGRLIYRIYLLSAWHNRNRYIQIQ